MIFANYFRIEQYARADARMAAFVSDILTHTA